MLSTKLLKVMASDRGGWNAIAPVLAQALAQPVTVHLFLAGVCAKQYGDGVLPIDSRIQVIKAYEAPTLAETSRFFAEPHQVTLLGTSQSAVGTKAALDVLRATSATKIVVVQDLYGSGVPFLKQAGQLLLKITSICVVDTFAQQHLLENVPTLERDKIAVTGGPHFDAIARKKQQLPQLRGQLRDQIGATADELLFFVAGQPTGTAESIALVEQAIAQAHLTGRARIIVRPHPRATWFDKRLTEYALAALPPELFLDVSTSLAPLSDDIVPAVDFVFSGYSTTNFIATLYGLPGVVYVGTPSHRWALWSENKLDKPPEVTLGAGWYAQSPEDLVHSIQEVHKGDSSPEVQAIKKAQAQIAHFNDGQATERVWQVLAGLLK